MRGKDRRIGTSMIAQALVEYGALHSIAASFTSAYNRVESLVGQGNLKYGLFAILAMLLLLLLKRRRI
jgi:hypothetical protein